MAGPTVQYVDLAKSRAVAFDPQLFDDAIKTQGVKLIHYRGLRCPIGLVDIGDNRRPDHDHANCSNGFHYIEAGYVTGVFTSNGEQVRSSDLGSIDGSQAALTLHRWYQDCDGKDLGQEVMIAPFDRFYLAEEAITVPTWQLFEHHATGKDRLQYPALCITDLIDSDGRAYQQGDEFHLKGGFIVWNQGKDQPRIDPETGRGQICSTRYEYRPYWLVTNVPHQIRVAQVPNQLTGERKIIRMNQSCGISREYVFQSAFNSGTEAQVAKEQEVRLAPAPAFGSFGPR